MLSCSRGRGFIFSRFAQTSSQWCKHAGLATLGGSLTGDTEKDAVAAEVVLVGGHPTDAEVLYL